MNPYPHALCLQPPVFLSYCWKQGLVFTWGPTVHPSSMKSAQEGEYWLHFLYRTQWVSLPPPFLPTPTPRQRSWVFSQWMNDCHKGRKQCSLSGVLECWSKSEAISSTIDFYLMETDVKTPTLPYLQGASFTRAINEPHCGQCNCKRDARDHFLSECQAKETSTLETFTQKRLLKDSAWVNRWVVAH